MFANHNPNKNLQKPNEVSASNPIRKIVILGAGPNGLYTAAKLKLAGFKDLTVIDPRLGKYTRPGNFNQGDFHDLKSRFNDYSLEFKRFHVKDAERYLFEKINTLNVNTLSYEFMHFSSSAPKTIIAHDEKKEEVLLTADLVLDCSGTVRAGVKATNDFYPNNPPFHITQYVDNPVKKHFLAYIRMSDTHIELLEEKFDEAKMDIEVLETLRQKFGWNRWTSPAFTLFNYGKQKVCIYSEVPDDLQENQKNEWLKTVFLLRTGKSDITFQHIKLSQKYQNKPRFVFFSVDPHKLEEFIFPGDQQLPIIVPLGDSQVDIDYRLGVSTKFGMNRIDMALASLEIKKGVIVKFDTKKYLDSLTEQFKQIEQASYKFFTGLRYTNLATSRRSYELAAAQASSSIRELYNKRIQEIDTLLENPDSKQYLQAKKEGASSSSVKNGVSEAIKHRDAGKKLLVEQKNYPGAKDEFEKSLKLFLSYNVEKYADEILKIYSSLVIIAHTNNDLFSAIKKADEALSITKNLTDIAKDAIAITTNLNNIVSEIQYNKADTILNAVLNCKADSFIAKSLPRFIGDVKAVLEDLGKDSANTEMVKQLQNKLDLTLQNKTLFPEEVKTSAAPALRT